MAELVIGAARGQAISKWDWMDKAENLKRSLEKVKGLSHLFEGRKMKQKVEKLRKSLERMKDFSRLFDERRIEDDGVKVWQESVDELCYDADVLLDKIQYEILRFEIANHVVGAPSIWLSSNIRAVKQKLKKINKDARVLALAYSTVQENEVHAVRSLSFAIDPIFLGRDEEFFQIKEMLMTSQKLRTPLVLNIVGMAGIGKTCLARQVYNEMDRFFDLRIWVSVSKKFNSKEIFELMLDEVECKNIQLKSQEGIFEQLKRNLKQRSCLVVLDDVWIENFESWESFKRPLEQIPYFSICILLTTRLQTVTSITAARTIYLETLSDDICWSILQKTAFGSGEVPADLNIIGKEIANKCEGLPQAAQQVGGSLRIQGKEVWLSILKTNLFKVGTVQNILNQKLKLSYDHLPSSSLKRCFLNCSIFPKDFILVKEEMIQLWMAEGLLPSQTENLEMEEKGDEFFRILVEHSLLQDVKMDMYGNLMSCKMHSLVHDFAQSILGSHVYASRALVLSKMISADVLVNIRFLRVLILVGDNVMKLPNSIGKLIHLRYLDLSKTKISKLPGSICKLYFLQTLRLPNMEKLPGGMKKLRSLRHLYFTTSNDSTIFLPHIGQLTCLRTLKFFNLRLVSGCRIEELGCLKNLGGELVIKNLQLVRDKKEAQMADLSKKSNMYKLEYSWSHNEVENRENSYESVLDGLEPHPMLKSLKIENYLGTSFPTWVKVRLPLNLVELKLHNCIKCTEIPSFGQLKLLRLLELVGFLEVECIGSTFYGVEANNSGSNSENANIKVFPTLEKLVLDDMPSLIEWKDIQLIPTTYGGEDGVGLRMFPELKELRISTCPRLVATPTHFEVLRVLSIEGVESAEPVLNICSNLTSLETLIIKDVKELTRLPDEILQNEALRLEIYACPKYTHQIVPASCQDLNDDIVSSMSVPLSNLGILSQYMDLRLEMLAGSYSRKMQNGTQASSYHNLVSEEDSYQLLQSRRALSIPENLIYSECIAGLTKPPPEKVWTEAVLMIMTGSQLSELPMLPNCHQLLLLLLQRNNHLQCIPNTFFTSMPYLRVLDLSNTKLKSLPPSLFELTELQVLILRNCQFIYEIPEQISALKSLEVLDLSGTELCNLSLEIGKLTCLKHLHLSLYGAHDEREASYLPHCFFSTDIIAKLPDLQALSFGVHPEDKRWARDVVQIMEDINRLQNLRYLHFYFPTVALLEKFIDMSHSWKNNLLVRFKLVVGQNVKRIVDRVSQSEEDKYEKHDRCLRFV